ncbi:MAG: peptide ABC transporter permease [Firmicutes bacterium HGW-Firmicutes-14]|nr:MAG: peptide ABC transporter permease [Firmicutes bacterium HGW-Firmicutes-14]
MLRFIFRRLLSLIPILLGISFVSSILFYIVPGDIVKVMMGQHVNPYIYANVRKALGLDLPFWQNFTGFVRDVIHGDLGYSFIQQRPVNEIIWEAVPVTVSLFVTTLVITIIGGIAAGVLAAVNDRNAKGQLVNVSIIIGCSVSPFLMALFLQLVFGVKLGWFPVSGISEGLKSYFLPGLAVGLVMATLVGKVTRASMLEVLTQEHVLFSLARGLRYRSIILRHTLRNALVPVFTELGLQISALMGGYILTETIFNLPGMGRLIYYSVMARDFPVLRGILFISAVVTVLGNLLIDIIYARVEPRITTGAVREE